MVARGFNFSTREAGTTGGNEQALWVLRAQPGSSTRGLHALDPPALPHVLVKVFSALPPLFCRVIFYLPLIGFESSLRALMPSP